MIGTMSFMMERDDMGGTEDRAEVLRRELLLLDPVVRADPGRVRRLLHPEFVEFGASGRIWDGNAIVEALAADSAPVQRRAVDLVPVRLSVDTILVTYRVDDLERASLRSSVWLRNTDGEWLLRFHQGTSIPSGTWRAS
jgi:ribonuclease HI